jgi:hypothetical protein
MEHKRLVPVGLAGGVVAIALSVSAVAADELPMEIDRPEPSAQQQGGPRPDVVLDRLRLGEAPQLTAVGQEARGNAVAFLDRAAGTTNPPNSSVH